MSKEEINDFLEKLKEYEEKFSMEDVDENDISEVEKLTQNISQLVTSEAEPSKLKVGIKKLHPNAVIPKYSTNGDAGLDLTVVEILNETTIKLPVQIDEVLEVTIKKQGPQNSGLCLLTNNFTIIVQGLSNTSKFKVGEQTKVQIVRVKEKYAFAKPGFALMHRINSFFAAAFSFLP